MFEHLETMPVDPILGLMAAFRADADPQKVDLGVGVYRNERGETPVLDSVRRAEQAVLSRQASKTYVAPAGNAGFNQAMEKLVFGDEHAALKAGRIRSLQTPGGCGALRVGAELIRMAMPEAVVHVSTPTWANHVPLLTGSGIALERYPYYDARTGGVEFAALLGALKRLPARTVVLLHGSCHNPTGADLSASEWREVLAVVSARGLVPYIDLAYQGLGSGVAEDAFGARLFAAELPEVIVAVSCSKNFGLYRERTGVLHVVGQTPAAADAVLSQLVRIARTLYSMPPDHGAAIVQEVLGDEGLRATWLGEVESMRTRIASLRKDLVQSLASACPEHDFSFIERQKGMFSYLGINAEQVRVLRERRHVYMTDDSRINVAGLRAENIGYVAAALAEVQRTTGRS
jgi:aspartate aminotransferase